MRRKAGRPLPTRFPAEHDFAHRRRGRRIGLLGGSFNPAHDGHRHISLVALARLELDAVWWLVSPQNPLKPADGMAPFEARFAGAREMARHPKIIVSDIERRFGTRRSARTIARLRAAQPHDRFVWLMGADLLPEMSGWYDWPAIFNAVPVAVFDRWPYARLAQASKAAQRFGRTRCPERLAATLASQTPPAWIYFHSPLHPASATDLRRVRSAGKTE